MKKHWMVITLGLAILSLAMLACSLGGAAKAPEAVATAQAVATDVKGAVSTPEPAPSTGSDGQPLSLQSRQAGLDKLKSYRMKWQAGWKSTESGSPQSVTWNWVEEFSSSPQALHWTWRYEDSKEQSKGADMEMWQVGNTTYMLQKDASGTGQCYSFSSDDQSNQLTKGLFSPNALGSISNARYVGTETVNGIKARHYKYDEKAIALFASGKASGDIWVATDDEYTVKETVNWSGVAGLFGAGSNAKGDGQWNWELTDVNQPITIQAPENCGGAASDIPVMNDATDKGAFGDTITYKSPSKLADVAAFYQKEMPAAGWKLEGEPEITDEMATLEFSKGGEKAQVTLSVDQGTTQVLINVSK